VIVPRKTVGEVYKLLDEGDGSVDSRTVSDTKHPLLQLAFVTLVSEADRRHLSGLRTGHPDRQRQGPERAVQAISRHAVDRVLDDLGTEKSRAIKLSGRQGTS
jgi:hypothetical protein